MSAAMKFAQARLSPPTFGQVASEAAIDTPDSILEMLRLNILQDATLCRSNKQNRRCFLSKSTRSFLCSS